MKKLLTLSLALAMTMSLAACGSSPSPASSTNPSESSSQQSSSAAPSTESASSTAPVDSAATDSAATDSAGTDSAGTDSAGTDSAVTAPSAASGPNIDRIKESGKLVMLTNLAFPPFEYVGDDGNGAGVDVDIANEIAKDLGVELEVVNMDFGAIIDSLNVGKGDFSAAGMTIKPDRLEQVDFSVEYATSAQYIIKKAGSDVGSDLNGLTVAVQESTTGDLYVTDNFETKEVLRFKSGLDAGNALRAGKCDAVVIDKLPAQTIAKNSSGELELLPDSLTEEKYAIAVKKGNPDLLAAINATLERLMQEGKVDEYINYHMTQA